MIENKLTDVPETMLITLWAKAEETKRADALLHDEKAVEIIDKIEYDFSKFSKAKFSQAGCCVRAGLIDAETKDFLNKHPDAVVVQLGAGIDARYERLQCPPVTHDKPVLLIIEGVLMYFESEQIKAFFQELCARFDNATILFDMLAFSLVGRSRQHDSLRKVSKSVEFKWSLLDTKEMETWNPGIRLEKELYMSKYDRGRFPFIFRMLYKVPYFFRRYNQRVVRLRIT